MNVLSLFDGISCGQVALERAGIKVDNYFAAEIDKYAIQVTMKNYPNTIQLGDVRNIDYNNYPKIDLVIGGSPCTYWSSAKKNRETTSDGEGFKLFLEFVKAIETLKPKYFLYENNFSIHEDIKKEISKHLKVPYATINSSLVSAQNRKRVYWTNIRIDDLPKDKNIVLKDILEVDVDKKYFLSEKLLSHFLSDENRNGYVRKNKFKPISDFSKKAYCLTSRNGQRPTDTFIIQNSRGFNAGGVKAKNGKAPTLTSSCWQENNFLGIKTFNINPSGKGMNGIVHSIFYKSPCLTTNKGEGIKVHDNLIIRKLTPLECERLQTLPDNYTVCLSNSQRYKCIGNGWTVDVIAHILKGIRE